MSWMCTTGLTDALEFDAYKEAGIKLTCNRDDLPLDSTNLVIRAGAALSPAHTAQIHLVKRIPMGGGLGGGSSNAAFTLMGLNQLWNLDRSMEQLAELGAALGSDVPFFFHGPSSVCTGRGQFVVPIPRPRPRYVLLIFPKISMPTPAVYRRFDEMELGSEATIDQEPDWEQWTTLDANMLMSLLVNDLEAPAFSVNPFLGEVRLSMERALGRIVRMSGSGSTLFTLYDHAHEAEQAANQLSAMSVNAAEYELAPDAST